jgi:hypothetical protein
MKIYIPHQPARTAQSEALGDANQFAGNPVTTAVAPKCTIVHCVVIAPAPRLRPLYNFILNNHGNDYHDYQPFLSITALSSPGNAIIGYNRADRGTGRSLLKTDAYFSTFSLAKPTPTSYRGIAFTPLPLSPRRSGGNLRIQCALISTYRNHLPFWLPCKGT